MTSLALYYMATCPYCVVVLEILPVLDKKVELRDVDAHEHYAQELIREGGMDQVPCLRIEHNGKVRWLYESLDIIAYLQKR